MPSFPVVLLPTLSAFTFDYDTNLLAAQDLVVAPNQIPFTPSKNAAVRIRIMLQFRRQFNRLRQLCRIKFHHSRVCRHSFIRPGLRSEYGIIRRLCTPERQWYTLLRRALLTIGRPNAICRANSQICRLCTWIREELSAICYFSTVRRAMSPICRVHTIVGRV